MGSVPHVSRAGIHVRGPSVIHQEEEREWVPYTGDDIPRGRSLGQPSNVNSIYKCFCDLSTIIHTSLYVLQAGIKPFTSRDVLEEYTRYLVWYDSLPTTLRLGQNSTPALLCTQ
jgi:hypothetical protein